VSGTELSLQSLDLLLTKAYKIATHGAKRVSSSEPGNPMWVKSTTVVVEVGVWGKSRSWGSDGGGQQGNKKQRQTGSL
jgi:hypothetical protein